MTYTAPVKDIAFVLNKVIGLDGISKFEGFEDATEEMVGAILEESARFTSEVLAPLNSVGDKQGSQWSDDGVTTPDGWKDAYQQFVEAGWGALAFPPEFGGQGLPMCVSSAVQEMWHSANMSFGLCPLLTQGAVDAIHHHASEEMKQRYLPKMVEGVWSGTMNLTEPQAGTDLAAIRSTAEPSGDHYLIKGQKIFITYGEQDLTENIIHLVLARLPDAPEGVKGISLFVVPKFLVNDDGSLGERNDLKCVSIEHKLGIHASPTCVMSYGDNAGAVGYLVGKEHHGLIYMFTMMNQARHAVGTTAIQANDLIGRKTARDGGQGLMELMADMTETLADLEKADNTNLKAIAKRFQVAMVSAEETGKWMLGQNDATMPSAVSVEFLMMMGRLAGGWMIARSAVAANALLSDDGADKPYLDSKIMLARYYAERMLPLVESGKTIITESAESTVSVAVDQL
ncbi:UNVERIFIED_CONTAM: hypothetical protein GTU68_050359 [Idotea baltica]|nr:hypothetical protein [Idotea baltica]